MKSPRRIKRLHEADVVLSRRLLQPGTPAYDSYYREHPEFKEGDERSRSAPGLLNPGSRYYHAALYAAGRANFEVIENLASLSGVDDRGKSAASTPKQLPEKVNPEKASVFIQNWLLNSGAHQVGFTSLEAHHLYTHKGRGPRSGEVIEHRKERAIAITVEMSHLMMQSAPLGTSVMESSEQYLRSGVLALKLAAWIRNLGYTATAHVDGQYEVICPLVAADAGLGVIGRMGLLITPRLGPRVRIAVVTTDLPLSYKIPPLDTTIVDFCSNCKKCARVCPSAAIPFEALENNEFEPRWQIDSEKCYHFWTTSGTDCGRCITVCPYSHPDNLFHRSIRWGIKNNLVFRRLAIKLDDLFYGSKPDIRPLPGWADILDET